MKTIVYEMNNMKYVVRYPANFDAGQKYPVILCLHGAGTRGTVQSPAERVPTSRTGHRHYIWAPNCSGSDKEQESFPTILCLAPPSVTGYPEGARGKKCSESEKWRKYRDL